MNSRPNILVVLFDSLAPRYIKQWGGDIDFFPEEALDNMFIVKNCYTAAPLTIPSIATILTGMYPENHGVVAHGPMQLDLDIPRLPQLLIDAGYVNILAVSDLNLASYEHLGLAHGFDVKLNNSAAPAQGDIKSQDLDGMFGNITMPFFGFMHHFCTHIPYGGEAAQFESGVVDPEEVYMRRLQAVANTLVIDSYTFAVRNDCILIILSDHGETFIGDEYGHSSWLTEETMHATWAILNTDAEVDTSLHSLIDVMPTILDILGIDCPPCDGISINKGHHGAVCCIGYNHNVPGRAIIINEGREVRVNGAPKGNSITYLPIRNDVRNLPDPGVIHPVVAERLKALGYIK